MTHFPHGPDDAINEHTRVFPVGIWVRGQEKISLADCVSSSTFISLFAWHGCTELPALKPRATHCKAHRTEYAKYSFKIWPWITPVSPLLRAVLDLCFSTCCSVLWMEIQLSFSWLLQAWLGFLPAPGLAARHVQSTAQASSCCFFPLGQIAQVVLDPGFCICKVALRVCRGFVGIC